MMNDMMESNTLIHSVPQKAETGDKTIKYIKCKKKCNHQQNSHKLLLHNLLFRIEDLLKVRHSSSQLHENV